MTKDEALKLALHGLEMGVTLIEDFGSKEQLNTQHKAIAAIYEALAQPEQKPVAWVSTTELLVMRGNALGGAKDWRINLGFVKQDGDVGLYTTPPQRTWVGLTKEERHEISMANRPYCADVMAAHEEELKRRNT